jgi:hypothetical protein
VNYTPDSQENTACERFTADLGGTDNRNDDVDESRGEDSYRAQLLKNDITGLSGRDYL